MSFTRQDALDMRMKMLGNDMAGVKACIDRAVQRSLSLEQVETKFRESVSQCPLGIKHKVVVLAGAMTDMTYQKYIMFIEDEVQDALMKKYRDAFPDCTLVKNPLCFTLVLNL